MTTTDTPTGTRRKFSEEEVRSILIFHYAWGKTHAEIGQFLFPGEDHTILWRIIVGEGEHARWRSVRDEVKEMYGYPKCCPTCGK